MEELTCPDHELFPEYEGKGNEKKRRNRQKIFEVSKKIRNQRKK